MSAEHKAALLAEIAEPIDDPVEETFVLFSQDIPSNDLGIIDDKATEIDVEINGHEYSIKQSSGLLKSTRTAGTTGAVVWKVTPHVAEWLSQSSSILWQSGFLNSSHNVIELGCGVAGIIGMAMSSMVNSYIFTDQKYVLKLLEENIAKNGKDTKKQQLPAKGRKATPSSRLNNLCIMPLDWEEDSVENIREFLAADSTLDVVLMCDCVYNTFLIEPLTQTCIDLCKTNLDAATAIVIAQQLRTDDVFEKWLSRIVKDFSVWRLRDDVLPPNLRSNSGYVVHIALLRSNKVSQ